MAEGSKARDSRMYRECQRRTGLGITGSVDFHIGDKNADGGLLVIASDNYPELNLPKFVSSYSGKYVATTVYDIGDKSKTSLPFCSTRTSNCLWRLPLRRSFLGF